MVGVSLATQSRVPAVTNRALARMHVPEVVWPERPPVTTRVP
jgi:hypothetical protein